MITTILNLVVLRQTFLYCHGNGIVLRLSAEIRSEELSDLPLDQKSLGSSRQSVPEVGVDGVPCQEAWVKEVDRKLTPILAYHKKPYLL